MEADGVCAGLLADVRISGLTFVPYMFLLQSEAEHNDAMWAIGAFRDFTIRDHAIHGGGVSCPVHFMSAWS
jgi:hypothetical protein